VIQFLKAPFEISTSIDLGDAFRLGSCGSRRRYITSAHTVIIKSTSSDQKKQAVQPCLTVLSPSLCQGKSLHQAPTMSSSMLYTVEKLPGVIPPLFFAFLDYIWDMMGPLAGLLKAYDLLVESKDLLVSVYPT